MDDILDSESAPGAYYNKVWASKLPEGTTVPLAGFRSIPAIAGAVFAEKAWAGTKEQYEVLLRRCSVGRPLHQVVSLRKASEHFVAIDEDADSEILTSQVIFSALLFRD